MTSSDREAGARRGHVDVARLAGRGRGWRWAHLCGVHPGPAFSLFNLDSFLNYQQRGLIYNIPVLLFFL